MSATPCAKCGHQNDPTRVFCQNCGSRLERAEPAPSGPSTTPVPVKRASRRPGLSPLRALGQFGKGVLALAFLGALIALLIQMSRVPDGVPPVVAADAAAATEFVNGVRAFSVSPFRRTLDVRQDQINNVLAAKLVAEPGTGGTTGVQFSRAFLVLEEGAFRFAVERKFLGLTVYFVANAQPLAGPEGATAVVTGGAIGRLPLHPVLVRVIQPRIFTPAVNALAEPSDLLRSASEIVVSPGMARVTWPGAQAKR